MSGPGSWLRGAAVRICRHSTIERIVDPILADLQVEYAAAAGSSWRRRGVLLRAYLGFWKALIIHAALSMGGRSGPGEEAVFRRAIGFACLAFALVTVLLALPPLADGISVVRGKAQQVMLALTLVPQALPISIPVGMCIGMMSAIRAQRVTRRDFLVTLTIAFTATCLVAAVIEWGLPHANQKFREMVIAELTDGRVVHIEPGLNELGFSGLARRTDVTAVRQYHLLWALTFAAIPLAVCSLAVAARLRRAVSRASLIVVMLFGYYEILWVSENSLRHGAPVIVVWAPNVVLLAAGLIALWSPVAIKTGRI
jgi:hypothetical protein